MATAQQYRQVAESVQRMAAKAKSGRLIVGTVQAVAGATCTVEPLDGTDAIEGVMLAVSEDGFLLVPQTGSIVYIDPDDEFRIVLFSQLERVAIKAPMVLINEGQNGGLVKVDALTQELNTIQQYLTQVQLQHNALVAALAAMPPLVSFAPALSPTAIPNPPQITLRPTLENFNVKH